MATDLFQPMEASMMLRFPRILLVFTALLCGWCGPAGAEPHADRCVILVTIDGLANFYFDDPLADMPTIHKLARDGARSQGMVSVFPTVTWPNHVALTTGATTAKTGVVGNSYLDRATGKPVALICDPVFDKDQTVKVPTVFDAAHAAGLKTAAISWPATRNAGAIDWNAPDMFGDGWDRFGTRSWLAELRGEGIPVDRQARWCGEATGGCMRDWLYTRMAAQVIRKHAPNLLLLHLVEMDHVEHRTGPRSPEAYWCARYSDDRIRELVEAVGHSKFAGKTTLFVCSDHGFSPVRHNIHPNVVLRKLGLLEVQKEKSAKQAAYCLSQGGASAVYVLDRGRRAQILKQLQEELPKIEGVEAVLDARQFTQLGQPTPEQDPRGADLWLAAKCGYGFDDAVKGEDAVSHLKTTIGTHGHLPDQPALLATCVVWGAGVKPGTELGKVSNLSIAPTIARILGVALPTADGEPLQKLLAE
jgi:predicted AlkP superfamily pyrophosphatase or phosphodiesterase